MKEKLKRNWLFLFVQLVCLYINPHMAIIGMVIAIVIIGVEIVYSEREFARACYRKIRMCFLHRRMRKEMISLTRHFVDEKSWSTWYVRHIQQSLQDMGMPVEIEELSRCLISGNPEKTFDNLLALIRCEWENTN